MNSTGVCFIYNGEHKYLNILNRNSITKSKKLKEKTDIELIENNPVLSCICRANNLVLKMIDRTPVPLVKKIGLSEWSRRGLYNASLCSDVLIDEMRKIIDVYDIEKKDIHICIENYSYASKSDNLIQIVELTHAIKERLLDKILYNYNNLHFITSPEIKMELGNGNYDKYDMLCAYVDNRTSDELGDDVFYNITLKNNKLFVKNNKKKEVITPVSDIIDGYFLARWMEKKISGI